MMFSNWIPEECLNMTSYMPCYQIFPPPLPPPPPPPPSLQLDLSLFVSTMICVLGAFLLFILLLFFLYLYITQSRRTSATRVAPGNTNGRENGESEQEERDVSGEHHVWRITTVGLQRSVIDSITVVGFKKGQGLIDGTECSVCLSEFEEDESLRLLPKCSHAFHINCIDTWLLSHKNCPLCRAPILLNETEPKHVQESGLSNNDLREEQESSGSTNLSRVRSDLANHCGSARVETVRRSFSIGGSSTLKSNEDDDIGTRSRRRFYSSLSATANFFSSSRRSRNQDSILPIQTPPTSTNV